MDRNIQMLNCDITDALKGIGYEGPFLNDSVFKTAINEGAKNITFTEFVSFITNELRILCNMDECVNIIKGPEDSASFLMEISSFLKELGCPYSLLTKGPVSERFSSEYDKLVLVDYLLSELMAARMVAEFVPNKKNIELKLNESSQAADLKNILVILKFQKPPANISASLLFQKLKPRISESVQRAGQDLCGKPIFEGHLSEAQWKTLSEVYKEFNDDYKIRREMLLKRLDVTIQSFQWSDKTKGKEDILAEVYFSQRKCLSSEPNIDLSDVLAARNDLAIIEKTSSASVRKNTQSSVNKVMIGQVPDRGGRPSEQAPPPPEMPSWQQRQPGGDRGGRGGSGRGAQNRGQSNYNQSGQREYTQGSGQWSSNQAQSYSGNQSYSNEGQGYAGNQSFGRGGSSGGYDQDYQQPQDRRNQGNRGGANRDFFEPTRSNYTDQYVQDNQQNQQYNRGRSGNQNYPRGRGGQGRSNYNRGGYR